MLRGGGYSAPRAPTNGQHAGVTENGKGIEGAQPATFACFRFYLDPRIKNYGGIKSTVSYVEEYSVSLVDFDIVFYDTRISSCMSRGGSHVNLEQNFCF